MPASAAQLTEMLVAFRDERDWKQFHTLRNLIASVSIEAGELLEITQWKSDAEVDALASNAKSRDDIMMECADVFLYLLLIADKVGFDLTDAAAQKIALNEERYPVGKAKGTAKKYTEL